MHGTVKWFDSAKGFGFITSDGEGPEVFVEYAEVHGNGFRQLVQGQRVEFDVRHAKAGPEARGVRIAGVP